MFVYILVKNKALRPDQGDCILSLGNSKAALYLKFFRDLLNYFISYFLLE